MLNYKQLRQEYYRERLKGRRKNAYIFTTCLLLAFICLIMAFLGTNCAHASQTAPININKLADAIYVAEGGAKTRHPYGILAKYKHTTPRQACINTIKSALKRWNGKGDFIAFLGRTYCPIGALNDPNGLNRNWVKNVTYYYNKGA